MAAALPIPPSFSAQTSRRSKEGRSRPNLSKICRKTKMCSFHLQGTCKRADSCSFAHDPNEIQVKPNLGCTKFCPALLSTGCCPQMSTCKFAHTDAELRVINVDELDVPSAEFVPSQVRTASTLHKQTLASTGGTCKRDDPEATQLKMKMPQTAPQVVSRLNDAAVSGALTLSGMVFHLTRIFLALYDARPEVADRVGVPADVLASATAEETWARAGLDGRSFLSFQEFARLCGLPSELMPRSELLPVSPSSPSAPILQSQLHSKKGDACSDDLTRDADAWSQCSTDDGSSDISVRTPSGWETPASCEDLEDAWFEPEVKVVNTFIHVSSPRKANGAKRARSEPRRLDRAA